MNKKAFTLVELLAVLLIISLVLVLAAPAITGLFKVMKENARDSKIKLIEKASQNYILNHKKWCKENNTADESSDYYECTISSGNLVDLGGYKKEENKLNTCKIYNPVDNSCMHDILVKMKINKLNGTLASSTVIDDDSGEICKLTGKPKTKFVDYVESLVDGKSENSQGVITATAPNNTCTNTLAYDKTSDNNLRYVGANPCNYVKFNGELWRIVGAMPNIENKNGKKETRIKLVKDSSVGLFPYDATAYQTGTTNWAEASLMKRLNGDYFNTNGIDMNYRLESNPNCVTNINSWRSYGPYTSADRMIYTNGLTAKSQSLIEDAKWYLGDGSKIFRTPKKEYKSYLYEMMKQNYNYYLMQNDRYGNIKCNVADCQSILTWTGKVALPYPSDYYLAAGGSTRNTCLEADFVFHPDEYTSCHSDNWFWNMVNKDPCYGRVIFLNAYDYRYNLLPDVVWNLNRHSGMLTLEELDNGRVYNYNNVNPAIYLKNDTLYAGGDGSKDNPYKLISEEECTSSPEETNSSDTTLVEYINSLVEGKSKNSTDEIILPHYEAGACSNTLAYDGTSDNNLRFTGINPCNYVKFNGELWRIIGVMNNTYKKGSTKKLSMVKLIRKDSLGTYSWDSSLENVNEGTGINDWTQADLMQELNGSNDYLSSKKTGYKMWYNEWKNSKIEYTEDYKKEIGKFYYKNTISSDYQKYIEDAKWNLGGLEMTQFKSWSSVTKVNLQTIYKMERQKQVWGSKSGQTCNDGYCPRATEWYGKIALPYPSDYGFSVGKTSRVCINNATADWFTAQLTCDLEDIHSGTSLLYSWMIEYHGSWSITPLSDASNRATILSRHNYAGNYFSTSIVNQIHPTLYLKADVKYKSGIGTPSNPFEIE